MQGKFIIIMLVIIGICCISAAAYLLFKHAGSKPRREPVSGFKPLIGNDLDLSDALEGLCAKHNQPAMAFALINSSGIIAQATVGSAVYGENKPVDMESRFHIGSTTKSMTAILIQMLADRGKLSYDTTLAEALPDIPMLADYEGVTIRDLLLNKAGIVAFQSTDYEDPALVQKLWMVIPSQYADPQLQRKEIAKAVLNLKPIAKPGSKAVYSNVGWAIAGLVAETAAGIPYEELIRREIFEPLEMDGARIGKWPASISDPDQPRGHYPAPDGANPKPQDLSDEYTFPDWMNPSGGVHCTITDYALYVRENLMGLLGAGKLLDRKGYGNIHCVQLTAKISDMYFGADQEGDMTLGYGWLVIPVGNGFFSIADGSGGTFYATMAVYPDMDIAFASFTNCGDGNKAIYEAAKLATGFDLQ
jgi:CubicO group peptidase (beta-lactamase class C family)